VISIKYGVNFVISITDAMRRADRGEYREVAPAYTEAVDSHRFEAKRKCRLSERRGDITSILILEPVSAAE
jgi:hypothetical protein